MRQPVMIFMHTERSGLATAMPFGADDGEDANLPLEEIQESPEEDPEDSETIDLMMEGNLVTDGTRVELNYTESELTGMEGSVTSISFDLGQPDLVSMVRGGMVSTALVFEPYRRHHCVYDTPFSSFEICVQTLQVRNDLLSSGEMELDYVIEIHGARAERCRMSLSLKPREQ